MMLGTDTVSYSIEGRREKSNVDRYLIDQMCGGGIKDVSKAKEHTKECALMDQVCSEWPWDFC